MPSISAIRCNRCHRAPPHGSPRLGAAGMVLTGEGGDGPPLRVSFHREAIKADGTAVVLRHPLEDSCLRDAGYDTDDQAIRLGRLIYVSSRICRDCAHVSEWRRIETTSTWLMMLLLLELPVVLAVVVVTFVLGLFLSLDHAVTAYRVGLGVMAVLPAGMGLLALQGLWRWIRAWPAQRALEKPCPGCGGARLVSVDWMPEIACPSCKEGRIESVMAGFS